MKTFLLPTDFSATAKNAAQYAIRLAIDLQATKIILYNSFQGAPLITEPTMPSMPLMDVNMLRDVSIQSMKSFSETLREQCPADIELEEKTEFGILSNEINEVREKTGADLIIMGVTDTSKFEEVLIGSTAISVFKNSQVPVIVVPSGGKYSYIKNIALATDLKNVKASTPVQPITQMLDATGAKLHVLNVYEDEKEISSAQAFQQELLQPLFSAYAPQFHFVHNEKFIDGINDYVTEHAIDLLIVIPKKHGFFSSLFSESHAKQLAFHSHVPLMYVHEEK